MAEEALPAPRAAATSATADAVGAVQTEVTSVKLKARQGASFGCVFASEDGLGNVVPLTGMQVRLELGERGGAALLAYDTAVPQSNLTLDEAAGTVALYLGATVTRSLPVGGLQLDLDLYDPLDPDVVESLASGVLVITPEVGS